MTANLSIPVVSAKDALALPISAIYTEPNPETKEMERFVYLKQGEGLYERRPVRLGVTDNHFAEVAEGLNAGEVVSLEEPPPTAEIKSPAGVVKKKKAKPSGRAAAATNRVNAAGLLPR